MFFDILGISGIVLKNYDVCVKVPMIGRIESLNVSVSAAIRKLPMTLAKLEINMEKIYWIR